MQVSGCESLVGIVVLANSVDAEFSISAEPSDARESEDHGPKRML